jgi:hypothetical protein
MASAVFVTMLTSKPNRTKYQYSDRLARPLKTAYFPKQARIASPKLMAEAPQKSLGCNLHDPRARFWTVAREKC